MFLRPAPWIQHQETGILGGGSEPLALILTHVGCLRVLPSLLLIHKVLVYLPLGEDEKEDTIGKPHGPASPTSSMEF